MIATATNLCPGRVPAYACVSANAFLGRRGRVDVAVYFVTAKPGMKSRVRYDSSTRRVSGWVAEYAATFCVAFRSVASFKKEQADGFTSTFRQKRHTI